MTPNLFLNCLRRSKKVRHFERKKIISNFNLTDYNTSARIAVCSIDETSNFQLESVFIITSARFCNYSRRVTNVDNCEGLILYEPGVNCLVFGSTNTSLWTIPHTAAPLFAINF